MKNGLPESFMKEGTTKDYLHSCESIDEIRPEFFMCAWNKILRRDAVCQPEHDSDIMDSTLTVGCELSLSAENIETWMECDNGAFTCTDLTDDKIIQLAQKDKR